MTNKPRRAVIYARYSTELQNPTSVEDQFRLCEKHAREKGWQVLATYGDHAMSSATNRRPEYKRLLSDLPEGTFDTILTESLDRISRDGEDISHFYKRARHNNVVIHTLDRGDVDIVDIGLAGLMGGMFLEGLSRRTHRGVESAVQKGRSGGGRSYGYKPAVDGNGARMTGVLEIDPYEAEIIQRIFTDFAQGISPLKIAAALNAEGVPAPRHGRKKDIHWRQNTINGNRQRGTGILNNELYVGRRIWDRQQYRKDPDTRKRVARMRPREEWQIFEVPELRIIDDKLWDAVKAQQDSLAKARSNAPSERRNGIDAAHATRRRRYLLSGLVVCGACGGNMIIAGQEGRRAYYCANHKQKGVAVCPGMPGVKQREIEPLVLAAFKKHMMTDKAYARFRSETKARLSASQTEARDTLRAIDNRLNELWRKHEGLMVNIESGRVPASVFDRLAATEAEIAALEAERKEKEPAPIELPANLPEVWRARVAELEKTLSDGDIVGRASDDLRNQIDSLVIRHHPAMGGHSVEVNGKLAEMLSFADSKNAASHMAAACSLSLVAGAGFEPAAFRL